MNYFTVFYSVFLTRCNNNNNKTKTIVIISTTALIMVTMITAAISPGVLAMYVPVTVSEGFHALLHLTFAIT